MPYVGRVRGGPGGHRYWRVGVFVLQGGATFLEVSELAWRYQGVTNTVPSCLVGNDITYSTPDTTNNTCGTQDEILNASCLTLIAASVPGFTVTYDFHAVTPADTLRVGHKDTDSRYPSFLTTYFSDDGSNWTEYKTFGPLNIPAHASFTDCDLLS